MNEHAAIFAGLAGLFALAAWLAIWARRQTPARHAGMALLVVGLAGLAVAAVETMGFPKPIAWAWEISGEFRVVGMKMVQDEAIYLYVDIGPGPPRSYALPWNNKQASELQGLFDRGAKGQFMMQFEWSWERREPPMFYPLPQPIIPMPKMPPPAVPRYGA